MGKELDDNAKSIFRHVQMLMFTLDGIGVKLRAKVSLT